MSNERHSWRWAALLGIAIVAILFRVVALDQLPAGLSHDEAYDALNAVDIMAGARPVFFDSNNGRESLFMYVVAGAFSAFGVGAIPLRVVSSAAGVLTVMLLFGYSKRLYGWSVGLLTAGMMAVSFWPVFESRLGLRASLLPACTVGIAWCLWEWAHANGSRSRILWIVSAGLLLGVAQHTYTVARFLPLFVVIVIAGSVCTGLVSRRDALVGLTIVGLASAIVFAPLGLYFWSHPGTFGGRAGQVNDLRYIALSGDLRPLIEDMVNTLAMFTIRGDPFMRYNLAFRPVFDPLTGIAFYLGLGTAVAFAWRFWTSRSRPTRSDLASSTSFSALCATAWLMVGILPSAITGESPHFLRAISAQPAVYLLAAIGLAEGWRFARTRFQNGMNPIRATVLPYIGCAFIVATGAITIRDYALIWGKDPEARHIYGAGYSAIAAVLAPEPSERVFVSGEYPGDLDRFVVDILRGRAAYDASWVDARFGLVLPATGPARYLLPRPTRPSHELVAKILGSNAATIAAADPEILDVSVASPASAAPIKPLSLRIGDDLELIGFDPPGETSIGAIARTTLYWRILRRPTTDLSLFVHMIDDQGTQWGQLDGLSYPIDQWKPGDTLVQWHDIPIEAGTPPGRYSLIAGAYRRQDGFRLPVIGTTGNTATPGDRVSLGSLDIIRSSIKDVPVDAATLDALFGDEISLVAVEGVEPTQTRGQPVRFTLFWRARKAPTADYTVFVHLIGSSPAPVAQADGPPARGVLKSTDWRPDDLIRDRRELTIPSDLPSGRYRILIGLYRPDTGTRLKLETSQASVIDRALFGLDRRGWWTAGPYADGDRLVLKTVDIR